MANAISCGQWVHCTQYSVCSTCTRKKITRETTVRVKWKLNKNELNEFELYMMVSYPEWYCSAIYAQRACPSIDPHMYECLLVCVCLTVRAFVRLFSAICIYIYIHMWECENVCIEFHLSNNVLSVEFQTRKYAICIASPYHYFVPKN